MFPRHPFSISPPHLLILLHHLAALLVRISQPHTVVWVKVLERFSWLMQLQTLLRALMLLSLSRLWLLPFQFRRAVRFCIYCLLRNWLLGLKHRVNRIHCALIEWISTISQFGVESDGRFKSSWRSYKSHHSRRRFSGPCFLAAPPL